MKLSRIMHHGRDREKARNSAYIDKVLKSDHGS